MNQPHTSHQLGKKHRFVAFGLLFVLLMSLLPVASQSPVSARSLAKVQPELSLAKMQPELRLLAEQEPNQMVAVIVQKEATDGAALPGLIQSLGGRVVYDLYVINSLAVDMPAGGLAQLAASQDVGKIVLDGAIVGSAVEMAPVSKKKKGDDDPINTYLGTLGVPQGGLTGAGITVAILDSGVEKHKDFGKRIVEEVGFNRDKPDKTKDRFGHGTFMAGVVGGDGEKSKGLYVGVAPGVNFINVKIGGDDGRGYESDAVAAMQWVLANRVAYNIRVANMSINSESVISYHQSLMDMMAELMWFNGIVVVTSAGNARNGNNDTIRSAPANDPRIITVGATTEIGDDFDRGNDVIAPYSAVGMTLENHAKPDLVAPGTDIVSTLANTSKWDKEYPDRAAGKKKYFRASGTSMSAPMVSGAAALMLQANSSLSPGQVKCMLMASASDLDGMRYLDVGAAISAAQANAPCEDPNATTPPSILIAPVLDVLLSGDINWNSINWNSINWNSINWNSINWNSINWNSINWNSINWNSINWNSINWNSIDWTSTINWNSINWNSINWNSINWNSISWDD